MSFLAPGFLAALALLALPWWLHRLRVQSADRRPFASLRFMRPAAQRVFTHRRIRYWVLLIARWALIWALVLAFAQPALNRSTAAAGPTAEAPVYLVVDRSASMQRALADGALEAAVRPFLASLDATPGLLSAGHGLDGLLPPGGPAADLERALAGLRADHSHLPYETLLRRLEARFRDPRGRPLAARLVLVSDFQAAALPDQVARLAISPPLSLALLPVTGLSEANGSLADIRATDGGLLVRARFSGAPDPGSRLSVRVNGEAAGPGRPLEDGEFVLPATLLPGENRIQARITGDGFEPDNQYFAVVVRGGSVEVPLLAPDPAGLAVTYLQTALSALGGEQRFVPVAMDRFDPRVLSRHRWVAVTDLGSVPGPLAAALERWVETGGHLLAGLGRGAEAVDRVPVTGHRLDWTATAAGGDPLAVGSVVRGHPLIGHASGWLPVAVGRAVPVQAADSDDVVVRLAGGRPLLLRHALGAGQVVLMTSDFGRAWNDLPAQPVFVPWLAAVAQVLSGQAALVRQRAVGEAISAATGSQLVAPAGGELFGLDASRPVLLSDPGFYELYGADGAMRTFAVNVDPRESDLRVASPERLAAWRDLLVAAPPRPSLAAAGDAPAAAADPRVMLLVVLLLVLAESLLGNRHLRARVS